MTTSSPFLKTTLGAALVLATVSVPRTAAQTITPGHVVVVRIGDGVGALSSTSAAVFLDEFDLSGGLVQTLAFPTTLPTAMTNAGSSTSEGFLQLSSDGLYLLCGGYRAIPGTASIATSSAATFPRVVARIALSGGVIDTSTSLGTTAFSGGNIRSVASDDGSRFWSAGSNTGIPFAASLGATTATGITTVGPTNTRTIDIFGGQLYVTSASGTTQGLCTIGSGLPTAPPQTIAIVPGFPTVSGPSSYDTFFSDASTVYVADDRAPGSGGIQKWTFNGATWSLAYTMSTGLTGTNAVRGLSGIPGSNPVRLFASAGDATSNNKLVTVADTGAGSSFSTLTTAGTNKVFRGVTYLPLVVDTTVDSLNGGELLYTASTTLQWTTNDPSNGVDHVDLFLQDSAGVDLSTIATNEPDDGSYLWDASLVGDGSYRVRVQAEDVLGTALDSDNSDASFRIDRSTTVATLAPNGGELFSGVQAITWSASDPDLELDHVELVLQDGLGVDLAVIASGEANDGLYLWDTTTVADGSYRVRVEARNVLEQALGSDASDASFAVNNSTSISVIAPDGGEFYYATHPITWATFDPQGDVDHIRLVLQDAGGFDLSEIAASEVDDGSYTWDTSLVAEGTYRVKVEALTALNVVIAADSSSNTFVVNHSTSVTLSAPNGGELFFATTVVSWSSSDPVTVIDHVELILLDEFGGALFAIASGEADDGVFSWNTTAVLDGTYGLRIEARNAADALVASDVSDANFRIDDSTSVSVLFPNSGGRLPRIANLTWSAIDPDFEIASIDLVLQDAAGNDVSVIALGEVNDGSASWDHLGLSYGVYHLQVIARNSFGQVLGFDRSDLPFRVGPGLRTGAPVF